MEKKEQINVVNSNDNDYFLLTNALNLIVYGNELDTECQWAHM